MRKIFVLFLAALLAMSSLAMADGPAPTIISTACTADSDCPAGQTCGPCPVPGACGSSPKICLAAAGTTPVAVPDDPNFPAGTSIIELCRYSEGAYGTRAGRGDRYPRAYAKNTLRLVQRDEYTFEATDIKSDGTVILKVTKEGGSAPKSGPYSLTLSDTTGTVNVGPAGQELKLVKYSGTTVHQYLKGVGGGNIGYNRMEGKCASFFVAPSSWENINLPFDTPFGTVVTKGTDNVARFKNGLLYSLSTDIGLTENSASTTVVVSSMKNAWEATEVARGTVNKGESKVIGPLRIQFEGTYRDGGIWRAGLAISDKDAQVVAAPAAVAQVTPLVAQKKPSLMARIFGTKTVARLPPATNTPIATAPSGSIAKTYKGTTWTCHDGSSGAEGYKNECMTLPQWQAKAKVVCEGKCNAQNTKCGVNTFSLGTECTAGSEATTPIPAVPSAGTLKCSEVYLPMDFFSGIAETELSTGAGMIRNSGKSGEKFCTENGYNTCLFINRRSDRYFYSSSNGNCNSLNFADTYFRPTNCGEPLQRVQSNCQTGTYLLLEDARKDIKDWHSDESVFCCK